MGRYTRVEVRKHADHAEIARKAREAAGEWVFATNRKSRESARLYKNEAENGRNAAYEPAGTYEVRFEMADTGYDTYIRTL